MGVRPSLLLARRTGSIQRTVVCHGHQECRQIHPYYYLTISSRGGALVHLEHHLQHLGYGHCHHPSRHRQLRHLHSASLDATRMRHSLGHPHFAGIDSCPSAAPTPSGGHSVGHLFSGVSRYLSNQLNIGLCYLFSKNLMYP
jgi:hypothetical protein